MIGTISTQVKTIRERVWTNLSPQTLRNIATVIGGQGINLALGFFASLIVVRTLSPLEFGLLSSASAIMVVIQRLMDLGIGNSMIRFASLYFDSDRRKSITVFNVALLVNIGLGFALIPVALWGAGPLATALFHEPDLLVLLQLAFVGAYFGGLTTYLGNVFRVYDRFRAYTVVNISSYFFKLVLVASLFLVHQVNVLPVFAAYVASPILGLVVGASLAPREIMRSPLPRRPALGELVGFGRWTFLTAVCGTVLVRLELFLLAYFASAWVVGIYSFGLFLYNVLFIVISAMNIVLLPRACQLRTKSDMWGFVRSNLVFSLPVVAALVPLFFGAGWLVMAVGTQKYVESTAVFAMLLAKLAVQVLLYPVNLLVYPLNKPQLETVASTVQIALTLLGGIILIPAFGAWGAATIGTISASVGMGIITVYVFLRLRSIA